MLVNKTFQDIITFTRASAATRINSAGVMESVAANVPRIDYDPATLAVKGLLVEEQRTNLLTYSADPTNAAWIKNSASIGAGATGPAGLAAQKLVEASGASLSPSIAQSATVADAAKVTGWRFIKAGERSFARMQIASSGGTAYAACRFNLADGAKVAGDTDVALNSATNVKSGSINWGGGWWLLWLSCTLPAGETTASIQARIVPDATTFAYTGDGSSGVYVGPAQLEVGGFPTSYIATSAAQVTRASDSARINTLSPWYNAAEGTIFAEITPLYTSSGNHAVWIGSDFDNYIGLQYSTAAIQKYNYFRRAGTFYMPVGARGDAISGETLKTATSYKAGQKIIESYGGVNRDGSDVLPAAPVATALALCVSAGGTGVSGARYIRKLRYYPKAMTNAEIAALTA